jgi:glyoxylase-like metal-dependent hydrolase (beta-lactamase superfamily II)
VNKIYALVQLILVTALWLFATPSHSAEQARSMIEGAATALGGQERIAAVRNITLVGFGQYAYMFGGGNITASPHAPQKFQAANDLHRVYDLEHGRFQQLERRNFLFPFAGANGHSYQQVNLMLDGDIAFDALPDGKLNRVPNASEGVLQHDGVHVRRMWMMTNPVVAIRAALDPSTKLAVAHKEDGLSVVKVTLKQGDKFAIGIDSKSNLPSFIRWWNRHDDLGEITYTTWLTGYAPYSGLLLPLGYNTNLDWRNIDYLKVWVDTYEVDTSIENLAATEEIRAQPEPVAPARPNSVTQLAAGVWRIAPSGTTVFEFTDHLTLFELHGSPVQAKAVIELAKTLAPGKPVTELVPSHAHFDHATGIRTAVAEGLTIISRRGNEVIFREMAEHRAPDYPDLQEERRRTLKFVPMDDHLRLSDASQAVDLYWARGNTHMADAVFAYVPAAKIMVEGDIATAAFDYQFWPDNYMDNIEHYKLDVQTLSPVHMNIMKQADVIVLIKGGVERARERCAAELAKGNYFPGCPIQSKRY